MSDFNFPESTGAYPNPPTSVTYGEPADQPTEEQDDTTADAEVKVISEDGAENKAVVAADTKTKAAPKKAARSRKGK